MVSVIVCVSFEAPWVTMLLKDAGVLGMLVKLGTRDCFPWCPIWGSLSDNATNRCRSKDRFWGHSRYSWPLVFEIPPFSLFVGPPLFPPMG